MALVAERVIKRIVFLALSPITYPLIVAEVLRERLEEGADYGCVSN